MLALTRCEPRSSDVRCTCDDSPRPLKRRRRSDDSITLLLRSPRLRLRLSRYVRNFSFLPAVPRSSSSSLSISSPELPQLVLSVDHYLRFLHMLHIRRSDTFSFSSSCFLLCQLPPLSVLRILSYIPEKDDTTSRYRNAYLVNSRSTFPPPMHLNRTLADNVNVDRPSPLTGCRPPPPPAILSHRTQTRLTFSSYLRTLFGYFKRDPFRKPYLIQTRILLQGVATSVRRVIPRGMKAVGFWDVRGFWEEGEGGLSLIGALGSNLRWLRVGCVALGAVNAVNDGGGGGVRTNQKGMMTHSSEMKVSVNIDIHAHPKPAQTLAVQRAGFNLPRREESCTNVDAGGGGRRLNFREELLCFLLNKFVNLKTLILEGLKVRRPAATVGLCGADYGGRREPRRTQESSFSSLLPKEFIDHVATKSMIVRLQLNDCAVNDEMCSVLVRSPRIRILGLFCNHISSEGLRGLKENSVLNAIGLNANGRVSDAGAHCISQCRGLRTVHLRRCGITEMGLYFLLHNLGIRRIILGRLSFLLIKVPNYDLIHNHATQSCLESLNVSRTFVPLRFLRTLSRMARLTYAMLADCQLRDDHVRILLQMPSICRLCLSGNHLLTEVSAGAIASHPRIEELFYARNCVSDAIAESFFMMRSLRELHISFSEVSDASLLVQRSVPNILFPNLRVLNVFSTKFTVLGIQFLRQRTPIEVLVSGSTTRVIWRRSRKK